MIPYEYTSTLACNSNKQCISHCLSVTAGLIVVENTLRNGFTNTVMSFGTYRGAQEIKVFQALIKVSGVFATNIEEHFVKISSLEGKQHVSDWSYEDVEEGAKTACSESWFSKY